MAVLGRYVITPQIFSILENTLPGKDGEIQLTDALRGGHIVNRCMPMISREFVMMWGISWDS